MRDGGEILRKLRLLMLNHSETLLNAYIVPSNDEHQSEYICDHDKRRDFISGFNGSAGTAVVTKDKALLWTDGRYSNQAMKQLYTDWSLMEDGQVSTPTIGCWLAKNLPKGSFVGVDPKLVSHHFWKPIEKDLAVTDCTLIPIEKNLIDDIWGDKQPKRTSNPIITHDMEFCGQSIASKWSEVKRKMSENFVHSIIVTALDEIAWFLNLRGSDIKYNPVFFSYMIITHNEIMLFVKSGKLPPNFNEHKIQNNIDIKVFDYEVIGEFVRRIAQRNDGKVWISPSSNYYLTTLIPENRRHQEITPICLNKALKNKTEAKGFVDCHIQDGVALCQYYAWLQDMIYRDQYVDELSGAAKLEEIRSKRTNYVGLSFNTMSASGPNASIIHYVPTKETNRQITNKEIYLCDSGAQYKDGTTDVTRTFHFGEPTEFEKEAYTRVLKGQLALGSAIFPNKLKGQMLDTIARKYLWDIGLDYSHGTGHGVGHYLNVHEGPILISVRTKPDDPGLQENMMLSNEPGYYEDGKFGIRIEDIVQIIPCMSRLDFKGRGALTFRTLTMCPKQTKMIKKELFSEEEKNMLNEYHCLVWETLSPILEEENDKFTLAWLKEETLSI